MNIFDRLDRIASRTVDRINDTPFIMTAVVKPPNGRPTETVVSEGRGVFDYVDTEYGIELGVRKSYREANDFRALQTGREPLLSVDRRYFPTSADEPKQGYRIEFPERPELPRFEVVSVKRDGLSRLSIHLVHLGSQA